MNFIQYYNQIKSEFLINNNFTCLTGKKNAFNWPDSSGVYVVWEKKKEIIYIGMTGKFQKNSEGILIFNNTSFKSRINRWTPYKFCENEKDGNMIYHFRYGPKEAKTSLQGQIRYNLDAYKHSISYDRIEIHCFSIDENHPIYSPILLESLLLTKYLKTTGILPPANNSL